MHRIWLILFALVLTVGIALTAGDHKYTGVNRCKMCHKGEAKGMIYEKWASEPHAGAYNALAAQNARDVYAKLGKSGDPQQDPECLKCHVTGYGLDSSLTADIVITDGVTCETCHGAGGDYWKKTVMENREESIANGMTAEPKTVCVNCHNEGSPTYKEFKFDEFWLKISHAFPDSCK